jgi:hypothetical protein
VILEKVSPSGEVTVPNNVRIRARSRSPGRPAFSNSPQFARFTVETFSVAADSILNRP